MPANNGVPLGRVSMSSIHSLRRLRLCLASGTLILLTVVGCAEKSGSVEKKASDTTVVSKAPATAPTTTTATPAGSDTLPMPPGAKYGPITESMKGIGVSRETIDKGLGEDYKFVTGDPIDGREAAYAELGDIHTLVIGPAENPLLASFFAPMLHDRENDDAATSALAGFIRSVNPAAKEWIDSSLAGVMKSHAPVVETRTFGDHRIEFEYGLYHGYTTSGYITVTVTRP